MPSGFAADLPRRPVRFRRAMTALGDAAALLGYLCVKYYLFGIGVRWRAALTRYDFCHAMDAMSLFAARGFAARGVPVLLDINEIADPFERQGAQFVAAAPAVKRHLARAFAHDVTAARTIVATSDAMADFVAERFGRRAVAIRNARAPLAVPASMAIRTDIGAVPETRVLVYPCTAAPHLGVEASIAMLNLLPEEFRLVFVGRFVTPAYRETIERLIRRHRLERRVLLKGELPDAAYLPYLAGADIGLVPLSFAYRNQRLVLPWRAIDLAAARVPMVASPSDAMRRLAHGSDIGVIASGAEAEDLAAAVQTLAAAPSARIAAIKHDLGALAEEFSPDREAARYRAMLGALAQRRAGRAAFVANLALRHHRRLVAFIDEACALGWRVDLYCVRAPDRRLFRYPGRVRCITVWDRILPSRLRQPWRVNWPAMAIAGVGLWLGVRQWRRSRQFARAMRGETARRDPWDIVIATDTFALAAGLAAGGPESFLVYDATETPDLRQRTSPFLRRIPAPLRLPFRRWERAYVRRAGLILAASRALADALRRRYRGRAAAPVLAMRNAASDGRAAILAAVAPGLRDRLGLPPGDIVLVSPCGISPEIGGLVAARMLRFLPADHVLIFIGRFSRAGVETEIRAAPRPHRASLLFHRRAPVPDLSALSRRMRYRPGAVRSGDRQYAAGGAESLFRPAGDGRADDRDRDRGSGRHPAAHRHRRGGGRAAARRRGAQVHHGDKEQARMIWALARRAGGLAGKRVARLTLRSAFSNRRFGRIAAALQAAGASVVGYDTDIGRGAPAAAQPDWLTTIAIR